MKIPEQEKFNQYLREQYTEDYLEQTGRPTKGNYKITCINPEHADNNPSMGYDSKRKRLHCFSCNCNYDLFDIVGIDNNTKDFKKQRDIVCEMYHVKNPFIHSNITPTGVDGVEIQTSPEPIPERIIKRFESATSYSNAISLQRYEEQPKRDYTSFYELCNEELNKGNNVCAEFLESRGISLETANKHMIGFDLAADYPPLRLVIPNNKYSYEERNLEIGNNEKADQSKKKYRSYPTGAEHEMFNLEELDKDDTSPIFIVESALDCMSFEEIGMRAIALCGTGNVNKFAEYIANEHPNDKYDFIIALDGDESGDVATSRLFRAFEPLEVECKLLWNPKDGNNFIYYPYKDGNEYLVHHKEEFKKAMTSLAEHCRERNEQIQSEYIKSLSSGAYLNEHGLKEVNGGAPVPTGFTLLDTALDGGLYSGVYTMGATSSLGKTTLMLQMADNIAKSGHDVLYFSLEMATSELIAKSISRHTFEIYRDNQKELREENARTIRGLTDGTRYQNYDEKSLQVIEFAKADYLEYADHMFIFESMGRFSIDDIIERIKKHMEVTGHTPVVFIDYLQILAPSDPRATDKQNVDESMLRLKQMSRDYSLPVFTISSLNRDNYQGIVKTQAFKESGSIEYSSDVILSLNWSILYELDKKGRDAFYQDNGEQSERTRGPRHITLEVLKNRNGTTGQRVNFAYYSKFNYYIERKEQCR